MSADWQLHDANYWYKSATISTDDEPKGIAASDNGVATRDITYIKPKLSTPKLATTAYVKTTYSAPKLSDKLLEKLHLRKCGCCGGTGLYEKQECEVCFGAGLLDEHED